MSTSNEVPRRTPTPKTLDEYGLTDQTVVFKVSLDNGCVRYWVAASDHAEALSAVSAIEPVDPIDTEVVEVSLVPPGETFSVTYPDDPPPYGFESDRDEPGNVTATAASWADAAANAERGYEKPPCVLACSEWG